VSIRVALAEDSPLLREGLGGLIKSVPDLELVALCSDLQSIIAAVDRFVPDVVLTDIRMPPHRSDEGVQLARHCRAEHPNVAVVLLSQYVDPRYVKALLDQGAQGRGYLLKEHIANAEELVNAVRAVAAGGSIVDPRVVEALVGVRRLSGDPDLERLTPRELEVLAEMAAGQSNAAIAVSLHITQRAVEKHINSIFSKLGVTHDNLGHPRVRAVLLYLTRGTR
jgi:DNA-binding NarL/FixJ family response regulator